jgi:hypothetical protein
MPRIMGFSHVELTLSDCDRAAGWWHEVLGSLEQTEAESPEAQQVLSGG